MYKSKSRHNLMNNKNEKFNLKYSNTILFTRRELELHNIKLKKSFNIKTFYSKEIKPKNNHALSPKCSLKKNTFPFLSLSEFQTIQTTNSRTIRSSLKKSLSTNNMPMKK